MKEDETPHGIGISNNYGMEICFGHAVQFLSETTTQKKWLTVSVVLHRNMPNSN